MKFEPMGDEAFLVRGLGRRAAGLARRLNEAEVPGLVEATACFGTLALYVQPGFQTDRLDLSGGEAEVGAGRQHTVPFCAEMGEDLAEAAERLGMTPAQVVDSLAGRELEVLAIGFCPGFPYLGPLPPEISGLPRREKPRTRVPQGSVAIAEGQACIYTLERPGGWNLVGRTPLQMVDVAADWFPLETGDRVRLEPISAEQFAELEGRRL